MRGLCKIHRLVKRRGCLLGSISTASNVSSLPTSSIPLKSLFTTNNDISTTTKLPFLSSSLQFRRTLCSSSDHSNIVLINSEEQFNTSVKNVQDKSLPAIFYFTAAWCGPCKFLSPILTEESKKYPDVTTYKIDIDQEGLGNVSSRFSIAAVPTLHFFQNGKRAGEIVGADIQQVKDKMEELYGKH